MPVNAPAVALCMIKREIRSLEQFLDRAAVAWPHRAADAASDVELALVDQIGLRHHVDEALRKDLHRLAAIDVGQHHRELVTADARSEEHTTELQSLMRNSYAVF